MGPANLRASASRFEFEPDCSLFAAAQQREFNAFPDLKVVKSFEQIADSRFNGFRTSSKRSKKLRRPSVATLLMKAGVRSSLRSCDSLEPTTRQSSAVIPSGNLEVLASLAVMAGTSSTLEGRMNSMAKGSALHKEGRKDSGLSTSLRP